MAPRPKAPAMEASCKLAGLGGKGVGVGKDGVAVATEGAIRCAVGGANCTIAVGLGVKVAVGTGV